MHISDRGVSLIAGFEGFSSAPYWDPYGRVWTRGYGETEGIDANSPHISQQEGLARLRHLVEARYEWAIDALGVAFTQAQYDALCSFAWNLGAGIFTGALREALLTRAWRQAADIMLQYDHAGGQVLPGLVTRRREEVALFLSSTAPPDPLAVLTTQERNDVRAKIVYSRHPRLHAHGLRVIGERLVRERKEIWLAAERGHDVHGNAVTPGWEVHNRRARYALLWRYSR